MFNDVFFQYMQILKALGYTRTFCKICSGSEPLCEVLEPKAGRHYQV